MATKIEWCEETWNPIVGCTKISPGCDHCYAERMAKRLKAMSEKYDGKGSDTLHRSATGPYAEVISAKGTWNGFTSFVKSAMEKPLHWKTPRKIFVCSMGDLFHESALIRWIDMIIAMAALVPKHIFIILTKRPEKMFDYFKASKDDLIERWGDACYEIGVSDKNDDIDSPPCWIHNRLQDEWPMNNLWLGVTAENQEQANIRISILLEIPAVKRFVSVEPMLGPIDFYDIQKGNEFYHALKGFGDISGSNGHFGGTKLDWVICGGESGPGARLMHPDWVRSLRDQCQNAGTPFFFKQWGEWVPEDQASKPLYEKYLTMPINNWPKHLPQDPHGQKLFFKAGKKAAGSTLDGEKFKEYPK